MSSFESLTEYSSAVTQVLRTLSSLGESGVLFAYFSEAQNRILILEKLLDQFQASINALVDLIQSRPGTLDASASFYTTSLLEESTKLRHLFRQLADSQRPGSIELRAALVAKWHTLFELVHDFVLQNNWEREGWWIELTQSTLRDQRPLHCLLVAETGSQNCDVAVSRDFKLEHGNNRATWEQ